MSWLYNGATFQDRNIPYGAIGFIYMMTAIIDGKSVCYIGKKNFYSNRKKKLKKAMVSTDKRKKNYFIDTKLNYEDYHSSNAVLKEAYKKGVKIKREMLKICYSKTQLTYEETKYLFKYEVLERDEFLNGNILGRFYKQVKSQYELAGSNIST